MSGPLLIPARRAILATLLLGLAGCSAIAGLFPDKQKQYQYTSEIPALEVPPDLSISTVAGAKWRRPGDAATGGDGSGEAAPAAAAGSGAAAPRATLAQNTEDVPLIEVAAAFPDAWNDVGRALGRLKVEVSDQNRSDGIYYVYYGGSKAKRQSQGMWDDIKDLFAGEADGGQEYRLKLEEHKTDKRVATDVFMFDDQGDPVRQGPPLDLLKQLHREIQNLAAVDSGEDSEDGKSKTAR
jgi:uncharacterized lipoprotein